MSAPELRKQIELLNLGMLHMAATSTSLAQTVVANEKTVVASNKKQADSFGDLLKEIANMKNVGFGGFIDLGKVIEDAKKAAGMIEQMKTGKVNFNANDFSYWTKVLAGDIEFLQTWSGKSGSDFNLDEFVAWFKKQSAAGPAGAPGVPTVPKTPKPPAAPSSGGVSISGLLSNGGLP